METNESLLRARRILDTLPPDRLKHLVDSGLLNLIAENVGENFQNFDLRGFLELLTSPITLEVEINYDLPYDRVIEQAGQSANLIRQNSSIFTWHNTGAEEVRIVLHRTATKGTFKDFIDLCGNERIRQTNLAEICALAKTFPGLQLKLPIFCLGQTMINRGNLIIPYISHSAGLRILTYKEIQGDTDSYILPKDSYIAVVQQ